MLLSSIQQLGYFPKRIISLVPSQTELLYHLGLEQETVGITDFCIHPTQWFQTKTRIGGTKKIKLNIIHQLQPDLIIANKEENVKEQVNVLAEQYPVWVTDIKDLDDALQMISDLARLTSKVQKGFKIMEDIREQFAALKSIQPPMYTAYLIWQKPYMTVGADTFIHDMLWRCGLLNIFASSVRYPAITIADLRATGCQLLLLSSEPYPFKQRHIDELQKELPGCKIILVDGEMFSWYGSRLLKAPGYFKELINSLS